MQLCLLACAPPHTFTPQYQSIFVSEGNGGQLQIAVGIWKNALNVQFGSFNQNDFWTFLWKWLKSRNADWMSLSITTCLLAAAPVPVRTDDKNIKTLRQKLSKMHTFWSLNSDYLSLLWKTPSIPATWSLLSEGFAEEEERPLFLAASGGGSSRDWLRPCLACRHYLGPAGDGDGSCTLCTLSSDEAERWRTLCVNTRNARGKYAELSCDITNVTSQVSQQWRQWFSHLDIGRCAVLQRIRHPGGNRLREFPPTNWFILGRRAVRPFSLQKATFRRPPGWQNWQKTVNRLLLVWVSVGPTLIPEL